MNTQLTQKPTTLVDGSVEPFPAARGTGAKHDQTTSPKKHCSGCARLHPWENSGTGSGRKDIVPHPISTNEVSGISGKMEEATLTFFDRTDKCSRSGFNFPTGCFIGETGGTRTPDLLVRRRILQTTRNHSSRQHPTKSANSRTGFRLTLDGFVPSSRKISSWLFVRTYAKIRIFPQRRAPG